MKPHLVLLAAVLWAGKSMAAQPIDAGQALESIKPLPQRRVESGAVVPEPPPSRPVAGLPSDVTLLVRGFRITGATAMPSDELAALIQEAVGRELSLADIQGLAARITQRYREHGFLLARAYLPAQDVPEGVVEIAILEGRLGQLNLDNRSPLTEAAAARQLAGLRPGEAIEEERLERHLLLLSDLPGVEVRSTLKPGASVGTSDLDVELTSRDRVNGSVEIDNYGNRFTGAARVGGAVTLNNAAGLGDTVALRVLTAGKGLNYGRAAYQAPFGDYGSKAGIAWSQMRYALGKDFSSLGAKGTAEVATAYLLQPLLRSRSVNVNVQLSRERKRLEDEVQVPTPTRSEKDVALWTLGLSGDRSDGVAGGGVTQFSLSLVSGDLDLDQANAALDRAGHQTQGRYAKLSYQLSRAQQLSGDFSLHGQWSGQRTRKNLDSSEKFSLGGPTGVRAYPQGEASADDAWLVNLELRYTVAPSWQLLGFYDAGRGKADHQPLPFDQQESRWLAGAGVGLAWARGGDASLQAFSAWKTAGDPVSDVDRKPRIWLQGVKYF